MIGLIIAGLVFISSGAYITEKVILSPRRWRKRWNTSYAEKQLNYKKASSNRKESDYAKEMEL